MSTRSGGEDAGKMTKQKGFSLIELLIVVAIILIIAAVAIPSFMRARMAANESSAVESLRSINTAEVQYTTTYGVGYAGLSVIGTAGPGSSCTASSTSACLVDDVLTTGIKSGYTFTITPGTEAVPVTYVITALPIAPGQSGQRGFCSDQTQVIRFNWTGTCDPKTDAALQ